GPLFIGWIFNLFFLGIIMVQGYIYMTTYQKDRLWMKLYTFRSQYSCSSIYLTRFFLGVYLYGILVVQSDDEDYMQTLGQRKSGLIASHVQLFFIWRIKVLTGSSIIAGAVLLSTAVGFIGAIFSTGWLMTPSRNFLKPVWLILWLIGGVISDLMITLILVQYLYRRHKKGFKASDELIDRIIRSTVQTGVLTSVVALLDLILYLSDVSPALFRHFIFNVPLCKLYSMTLMSSLNLRQGWVY
ncbi:hypothetical protein K435DRAFT_593729, partial [Dendrothele bispora CBS 962.96]